MNSKSKYACHVGYFRSSRSLVRAFQYGPCDRGMFNKYSNLYQYRGVSFSYVTVFYWKRSICTYRSLMNTSFFWNCFIIARYFVDHCVDMDARMTGRCQCHWHKWQLVPVQWWQWHYQYHHWPAADAGNAWPWTTLYLTDSLSILWQYKL